MWTQQSSNRDGRDRADRSSCLETGAPLVRGLHSLRDADARVAELMLPILGAGWSMTRQEDFDGDLMLLLSRDLDDEDGEGEAAADFALHRTETGVQLGQVMDEHYEWRGEFASVSDAVRRAALLLGSGTAQASAAA